MNLDKVWAQFQQLMEMASRGAFVMQWLANHGWQGCFMTHVHRQHVVKDYLLSLALQKICSFVVRTCQYLKIRHLVSQLSVYNYLMMINSISAQCHSQPLSLAPFVLNLSLTLIAVND